MLGNLIAENGKPLHRSTKKRLKPERQQGLKLLHELWCNVFSNDIQFPPILPISNPAIYQQPAIAQLLHCLPKISYYWTH
jgi:hypothetical protein